jgi:phenylalanyl-tRNA synthetase beta chain
MNISYNWLKEYVDIDLDVNRIGELLTDSGLEVEGIEDFISVKGGFDGLFVGKVLTCEKHPNADKLNITTVNIGQEEPLNIVCGAPNVAVGQKVIVATVGCTLHPNSGESFKIKKGKIRGEVSMGMICAEDEIGLGIGHDGILVLDSSLISGTPISEVFKVEKDKVIEIGLTPNRAEAASHIGTARDLLALSVVTEDLNVPEIKWPNVDSFKVDHTNLPIQVTVENTEACVRYTGVSMTGVQVKESPEWLQNRLKAIGLSPINNIVDISNFVLHEVGQPLHIFDADQIEGNKIIVKTLPSGTKFATLDEVGRVLDERDLMICDESNGLCIAGVFGGIHSGVSGETTNIFIESANFNPVWVRKTAKRHGLNTDASFRFERGVDPALTEYALKRATLLIKELAGGEISSEISDFYPNPVQPYLVDFRISYCNKIIGKNIPKNEILNILEGLDIQVIEDNDDLLKLSVPFYRVDVQREIDVIEEVLRIYGYNNIELPTKYNASVISQDGLDHEILLNKVSDHLTSNGFMEAKSNSLTSASYYEGSTTWPVQKAVRMKNPLSIDLNVLRQTMLFDALETVKHNQNRQTNDLKFYEFGKTYQINEEVDETYKLSFALVGRRYKESWAADDEKVGLQDLKGYLDSVFNLLHISNQNIEISDDVISDFEYGITFKIKNKTLAQGGLVSSQHNKGFGIKNDVFFIEINWSLLKDLSGKHRIRYQPVPKFPQMRRDLSLLVNNDIQFSQIKELAQKIDRKLLKEVNLFDVYEGKNLPNGKKSYAVSFVFQHADKTLTDKQVDKIMQKMIKELGSQLNAELR